MDPNAAYKMMTEHYDAKDYSEAYDVASGLLEWLRSGGTLPTHSVNRKSTMLTCRAVMKACEQFIEV